MLPPFYYKDNSDEGLFRSYSEVIQRVGDDRLRIYLYHIPPVAQVPITLTLIERLLKAYPGTIAGVKDCSGQLAEHPGDAGAVPAARLRRLRRAASRSCWRPSAAAAPAASRRPRTSTRARSRGWRRPGSSPTPTPSRPRWTLCATSSRAT